MLSLSLLPNMGASLPSLPSSPEGRLGTREQTVGSSSLVGSLHQTLQEALRELNLPETRDLPQGMGHSELCICVLGSPLPYLSLLLEAGQRSPGDALLCLSPAWLSRCPASSSLMVHRAVTFDLGGRTFLSSFNPPRRVTYLLSCEPYADSEVTHQVDCPIGMSGALVKFWGDTLTTRVLLQGTNVHTPRTLAVLVPPGALDVKEGWTGSVEVVHLVTRDENNLLSIRKKVDAFLESEEIRHSDKVVVRCSGGRFAVEAEGFNPVYLPQADREEVWFGVARLLRCLLQGEAVLLEAFCPPLKPGARVEDNTWEEYTDSRPQIPDLSFRVCAIITRSPQNIPLLYKLVCRVGPSHTPLSHSQSLVQSLDTTLSEGGFTDPKLVVELRRLATNTALTCARVVMDTESDMSAEQRGGIEAQTDMIGVDLVFTSDGSIIKPVVLGLHSSHCLQSCCPDQEKEAEIPDGQMEAYRGTLLLSPFIRSQHYQMQGKSVLVVGAGAYSKKFIWEAAKLYKIKILLVDCDPNHFASKMVDHFLHLPDLTDHRRDDQHCTRICDWLSSNKLHPDGCVCFWDDCVILTSLLCNRLNLRGSVPEAVSIAKEKSRTHLHLLSLVKAEGSQSISAELPAGQADSQAHLRKGRTVIDGECLKASGRDGLLNGATFTTENTCTRLAASSFPLSQPSRSPLLSPSPSSYAVPCFHVESILDLKEAARGDQGPKGAGGLGAIKFPAVLKLEYGAGAVGVRKVNTLEESLAHFERIGGDLREETDYPGIGLGWGNSMLLMEYVGGTEHDVDLILFDGRLEGAFVSDNGPTRAPAFTETAAEMPSGLASDKRAQLIRAAHHACLGCGLRDGVYNVELKMTEVGPRLIEINARMGGFYLRDWILQLYGVDLLAAAFAVACGVQPRLPSAKELPARGHFAGVMCVVSQHLQALRSTACPERLRSLHQEGLLWLNELAADDELIAGEYEEPFCNVGVWDSHSAEKARQRLLTLCQGLGLHCPPRYDLRYFLSHFS